MDDDPYSCRLAPGDIVVCVDYSDYDRDRAPDGNLAEGQKYVVTEVDELGNARVEGCRHLSRTGRESSWGRDRFNLVKRAAKTPSGNGIPDQPAPSAPW